MTPSEGAIEKTRKRTDFSTIRIYDDPLSEVKFGRALSHILIVTKFTIVATTASVIFEDAASV
jgi:hypothetical protein